MSADQDHSPLLDGAAVRESEPVHTGRPGRGAEIDAVTARPQRSQRLLVDAPAGYVEHFERRLAGARQRQLDSESAPIDQRLRCEPESVVTWHRHPDLAGKPFGAIVVIPEPV